jgi:amino acid efflux transporter
VQAPIAVLLASFAGEASGRIVAMLGFLIIVASLTSAVWAASRLVFATAREGMLPAVLRHVDSATGVPRAAVLLIAGLFCAGTMLNVTGLFSINVLYQLAGQSLFVIYGLCVLSFVRIARSRPAKVFGIATLVPVVAVAASFGYGTLYALTVMGLGIAWKAIHAHRHWRVQGTISG